MSKNRVPEYLFRFLLNDRFSDLARLFIRLFIGVMMLTHGVEKISHFSTLAENFPPTLGLNSLMSLVLIILIEVGCSLLLIVGLMTRFAVLPLIAAMTVAAFFTYTPVSLAVAELPMLYLSIYFFLFIAGPGKWSLDYLLALPYFPDTKELPLDDPFPFE